MGHDIYCFIERRVGDEWLVCREDGSIFDIKLTASAYKEAKAAGSAFWQYNDVLNEIQDVCGFDIPRNYDVYYCLLGWEGACYESHDVITPRFNPEDASDSFMSLICAEHEEPYHYSLTLQKLLEYNYELAMVTEPNGTQIPLKDCERHYTEFKKLIERMSKVDANPKDIRVIMRHE